VNRHSIFFRLNLLFLTALGILLWLEYASYQDSRQSRRRQLEKSFLYHERQIRKILLGTPRSLLASSLREQGYLMLPTLADELPVPKRLFMPDPPQIFGKNILERLKDGRLKVYANDKRLYLVFSGPSTRHIIATDLPALDIHQTLAYGLTILLLFVTLYLSIRKTLAPLQRLSRAIERYGDGEMPESLRSDKKDEIATIANRFDEAIRKIESIREAHNLFMRNIMHELKTPITKGKLSLALIEDGEEKEVLQRAFERMNDLVVQMAEVERFASQSFTLHLIPYHMDALIQEACAHLFLPKPIFSACDEKHLYMVDKELMMVVFKNLIDNALKYGKAGTLRIICIEGGKVRFENEGPPFEVPFEKLIEPFTKGEAGQNRESFGLGLYIIHAILEAHGAKLTHRYEEGWHLFTIEGLKPLQSLWQSDD